MSEAWNPDKVRLQVARDLREIVRLWRGLSDEAEYQAVSHDAGELDPINLAGPAANVEAWTYKIGTARRLGRDDSHINDQTAELHPLLVLATWEDAVRDERDQPTDLKATVERAADYLAKSVDWMLASNEYGDMNFIAIDDLADELRRCRRMLEDVTKEGNREQVSRVWCIADKHRADDDDEDGERVRLHFKPGASVSLDRWVCPDCKARYDYNEFISARRVNLHDEGADRFVLVRDAREVLGIPKPTLDSWITRMVVRAACNIRTRRVEVWWPDVREADAERQRTKELRRAKKAG